MMSPAVSGSGSAIVGVADHAGWAVLVTAAADGTLLDRRRIELVDDGLPKLPHHHEAQALPPEEALDPTVAERLRNYRGQNVADTAMYRTALAGAAAARPETA